jgi:chaperonin GroES
MQPRLVKTLLGQYEPAQFSGVNESGFTPVGDRVIVMIDQAADQTEGGIYIDDTTRERHAHAAETGVLVAAGPDAFLWNSDRSRKWEGDKPVPGDRVFFDRYSGGLLPAGDGKFYRCMDDKCIGAVKATAK